jgi:hypothetical protein
MLKTLNLAQKHKLRFGPPFLVGHLISYSNFCLNVSNSPYMMHFHIPITVNDTCWPNPYLDIFSFQ